MIRNWRRPGTGPALASRDPTSRTLGPLQGRRSLPRHCLPAGTSGSTATLLRDRRLDRTRPEAVHEPRPAGPLGASIGEEPSGRGRIQVRSRQLGVAAKCLCQQLGGAGRIEQCRIEVGRAGCSQSPPNPVDFSGGQPRRRHRSSSVFRPSIVTIRPGSRRGLARSSLAAPSDARAGPT